MSSFEDKNGIAIWWKHEEDVNQKPKIHLDINVWNTVKRDDIDYIEFGIKVENFLKLKEISIYLPYDFKVEDIEDKSSFFNNKIFANALFNEKVILKSDEKDRIIIERKSENEELSVLKYTDFEVKDRIITIKQQSIKEEAKEEVKEEVKEEAKIKKIYYRIRVKKLDNIFTKTNINNFFFEGILKDIGFVEFDINVYRRLPDYIVEKIDSEIKFSSINFFYMTDTNTNLDYQNIAANSSRLLEKHIWSEYLNGQNKIDADKQKIIAFFWKKKDDEDKGFNEFSLFIKTSSMIKTKKVFLITVIVLLSIGIISGIIGNFLTNLIKDIPIKDFFIWLVIEKISYLNLFLLAIMLYLIYLFRKKIFNILSECKKFVLNIIRCRRR